MNHDDAKKEHELMILEDTIALARKRGGEGRRNAAKLSGRMTEKCERPDSVIDDGYGRLIGIEHFRVDHHVRKDAKCKAKVPELLHRYEQKRIEVAKESDEDTKLDQMKETVSAMGCEIAKIVSDVTLDDLVRSFQKRLFDGSSAHASKLTEYRANLQQRNPKRIEMGYLIEIHSDFSQLYLNTSQGAKRIALGEMPLLVEVWDLLEHAARDVDWILLAFCEPLSGKVKDAAIVKCRNGMFSESLKRQGLERVEYLGLGKKTPKKRNSKLSAEFCDVPDSSYTLRIAHRYDSIAKEGLLFRAVADAAQAVELDREGKPFVSTLPVQMIYELLRESAGRCNGRISFSTIMRLLHTMPYEEAFARMEAFGDRWGINKQRAR